PQPGDRAPDCAGLTAPVATYPLRLLDILRGRTGHVVLLYAAGIADLVEAAEASRAAGVLLMADGSPDTSQGPAPRTGLQAVVVLAREAARTAADTLAVPGYRDAAGEFARLYRPDGSTGFVVRPDGQLGARFPLAGTATALADYLAALSAPL
ncbi:FAD-dependent monooxygenase, partial [Streptomyces sp. NPDC054841]